MTLLITLLAAIASTLVWYNVSNRNEMRLGTLCLMYWGASIMWFVDAIYEYAELGTQCFTPEAADMLNDLFLGVSVVTFGLLIWLVLFLAKDPKGVIKSALKKS